MWYLSLIHIYCVGELAAERNGVASLSTGLYAVNKIFGLE